MYQKDELRLSWLFRAPDMDFIFRLTSVSSSVVFPLNIACSLMMAKPLRTGDFFSSSASSEAGDLLLAEVVNALFRTKLNKLILIFCQLNYHSRTFHSYFFN